MTLHSRTTLISADRSAALTDDRLELSPRTIEPPSNHFIFLLFTATIRCFTQSCFRDRHAGKFCVAFSGWSLPGSTRMTYKCTNPAHADRMVSVNSTQLRIQTVCGPLVNSRYTERACGGCWLRIRNRWSRCSMRCKRHCRRVNTAAQDQFEMLLV